MKCPRCKASIEEDALKANKLRCPHCSTRVAALCKYCGAVNPVTDFSCASCGGELLKRCGSCGSINFSDSKACRKCGLLLTQKQPPLPENPGRTQSDLSRLHPAAESVDVIEELPAELSAAERLIEPEQTAEPVEPELEAEQEPEQPELEPEPEPEPEAAPALYLPSEPELTPLPENPGRIQPDLPPPGSPISKAQSYLHPQNDPVNALSSALRSGNKKIISISGPAGKTTLFKVVLQELQELSWVYGKCTPLTQLTPGGLMQDILLNVLGLSNFCVYNTHFKRDAFKFFQISFPGFHKDEINTLINFLYPVREGRFEDMFKKKESAFELLAKIFDRITMQGKLVFVIDHFDLIDGFSYEFLNGYIQRDYTLERFKLLLLYNHPNPAQGYLYLPQDDIYADIVLAGSEYPLPVLGTLPDAYRKVLAAAAIMGEKINFAFVAGIIEVDIEAMKTMVDYLEKAGFIAPLNNIFCEFSSRALYENVAGQISADSDFEELNRKVNEFLSNFTLSSNAVLGITAQNLHEARKAFDIWSKNARLAAYVGDAGAYAAGQKQALAMTRELDESEAKGIRYGILEQLGELLAASNPQAAMDYLQDAVAIARELGDTAKEIEFLAYISSCCRAAGYYHGEIECVDIVLDKVKPEQKLNIAALKTIKLQALLNIGNCGQVINMIDNDVMPILDECINKKHHRKQKKKSVQVFDVLMKTYLLLANALILQGSKRAFEVLGSIAELIDKYKVQDPLFICKYKIAFACAYTMDEDLEHSEEVLRQVPNEVQQAGIIDGETISRFNLITIINRFIRKDYDGLQEEMSRVAMYAQNVGDNFTKNILKILLGKILEVNGQKAQAKQIYNEQAAYFAKEKQAVGALLAWYLAAQADPANAVEIAIKAMEVAQDPQIDNHIFANLLNKMLVKV